MSFFESMLRAFPVPAHVSMPSIGLDISDHSIKFVELIPTHRSYAVGRFATKEIPQGIIIGGIVAKRDELLKILSELREEHGLSFVRASLPEEPGYIFTTNVPIVSADEIRSLLAFKLEEHVPIAPAEAIVDFDEMIGCPEDDIHAPSGQKTVAVSVYPIAVAAEYTTLLREAGFKPVSLEVEAQGLARAVVPSKETCGCMAVDVGSVRSGITVVGGGAVRFTTTVEIGGDALTTAIQKAFPKASPEEIMAIKNTEGLAHRADADVRRAFETMAQDLAEQIERYYMYWQTRKDTADKKLPEHRIKKIFLSGGYANIAGLPEYIERAVRVPVARANVWTNVLDIRKTIPPISYEDSLGYAPAIGLALRRD